MPDENDGKEIDLTIGGQTVRAKGYRLVDLVWPILGAGLIYIGFTLYHHAEAGDEGQKKTAEVLRESNKALLEALKENNANTVRALEQLATEQRKGTSATKEVACLNDPMMKDRRDARDFCKRVSQ